MTLSDTLNDGINSIEIADRKNYSLVLSSVVIQNLGNGDGEGEKKGDYTPGKGIYSNHVSKKSLKRIDYTIAGYYSKISERV